MNSLQEEYSGQELNLLDYWRVIWKRKIFIVAVVLITVLATAVHSLYIKDIYQATAIIAPVSDEKSSGGLAILSQQFGGLPGISLPSSVSTSEIINLLKSNMIREKILEKYNLLPVLFPEGWNKENIKQGSKIPTTWDGLRRLKAIIAINNNIKENTISVSAEFNNPEMTAKLVNYLLTTLAEHMGSEAKRAALTKRRYLEEQLRSTSDPLIRQKIYNLISQQVETAMMSEMKEDFVFKVLDPPRVPDRRIRPERRQRVLLSFAVSLFIGIFLAFFLEYIKNLRAAQHK